MTPPDTELITVSRTGKCAAIVTNFHMSKNSVWTVGADRIIDEMIFKCTHTTVCIAAALRLYEKLIKQC